MKAMIYIMDKFFANGNRVILSLGENDKILKLYHQ